MTRKNVEVDKLVMMLVSFMLKDDGIVMVYSRPCINIILWEFITMGREYDMYVYIECSILTWKIENAIVVSALSLVSSPTLKMSMPQLLDCSTIWNVEEISFYYLFLHILLSPKRPPTNSRKSTYSEMSDFIISD